MKRSFAITLLAVSSILVSPALAGLVSVNFTDTTPTGKGGDGDGFLGSGVWNRYGVMDFDSEEPLALVDSVGADTSVTISGSLSGAEIDSRETAINGNGVQDESWTGVDTDALLFLTVTGLLPGQVYEVVVYSDRDGTGEPSDEVIVAGQTKDLPNPGSAATVLPGTEDEDFIRFFAAADASGEMLVISSTIAGLQIQGRLTSSEPGSRIDAVVSRISGITTGKGENRYGKGRSPKDTASLKAKRRGVVFYPALQNDGSQVDYCYLKLKYNKREADVKLRDRVAGGNVTAAAATGRYRFILDNQDARGFKMKVKSLKEKRRKIRLRFCGSPSTRDVALSDCVTCELKQKKKK
ncbi:MAG: hypothetical protein CMO55_27580 [Verrucomicrobiales bacterium]|nr:hypothetical protein [Verrucomicrobiales bacterium]